MSEPTLESELQRLSEEFLGALDALRAMEQQKRALEVGDPLRHGLAIDIEELALGLLGRSQYQTLLTAEQMDGTPPEPRHAHVALDDWRAAERRLREANLAARRAALETVRFHEEYHRSVARVETNGD
jgi:hypothetical protein